MSANVTRSPLPMGDREIASTASVVASRGTAPDQRKVDVGALENSQPGAASGSLVRATYMRMIERFGAYMGDEPIEIEAPVTQRGDDLIVPWIEVSADVDLDDEEVIGAQEAAEEKFWSLEAEACRVSKVRQSLGTEAA